MGHVVTSGETGRNRPKPYHALALWAVSLRSFGLRANETAATGHGHHRPPTIGRHGPPRPRATVHGPRPPTAATGRHGPPFTGRRPRATGHRPRATVHGPPAATATGTGHGHGPILVLRRNRNATGGPTADSQFEKRRNFHRL